MIAIARETLKNVDSQASPNLVNPNFQVVEPRNMYFFEEL